MTQKKPVLVPFDKDGNQLEYAPWWHAREGGQMKENPTFTGTLEYVKCWRGRSATNFQFRSATGKAVVFRLVEFERLIPHMINGRVSGDFAFNKRGENYSCVLVTPL